MRKAASLSLCLLLIDRVVKSLVMSSDPIRVSESFVLTSFLNTHPMTYIPISGEWMVFAMPFTHAATLAVLAYIVFRSKAGLLGWSLLAIGYTSNAVDCWLYAGVVDPITVPVSGGWWLGFNIADVGIAVGTLLLVLSSLPIIGGCLCRLRRFV